MADQVNTDETQKAPVDETQKAPAKRKTKTKEDPRGVKVTRFGVEMWIKG